MFEKFSDYMYSLLFTPLKKVRQAGNQFYLFFKVVGKLFDNTKSDIFRVREESIVASASEVMLPEHGKDRDMPRLKGETVEGYRTRLSMKAIIAEKAGTEAGILLALLTLGYKNSEIVPASVYDRDRWAEFYVFLKMNDLLSDPPVNFKIVKKIVMDVKQASALPIFRYIYPSIIHEFEKIVVIRLVNVYTFSFWNNTLFLDGSWLIDGTNNLDSQMTRLETKTVYRTKIPTSKENITSHVTVNNNLWYLDGSYALDGMKVMDAYRILEEL